MGIGDTGVPVVELRRLSSFVVNPVATLRDEVLAAAVKLDDFLAYVMRRGDLFPGWEVAELIEAAELVRSANTRRYFGGGAMLWPSRECVERAWDHQCGGGCSATMPSVLIKLTDAGELYYEI